MGTDNQWFADERRRMRHAHSGCWKPVTLDRKGRRRSKVLSPAAAPVFAQPLTNPPGDVVSPRATNQAASPNPHRSMSSFSLARVQRLLGWGS